MKQPPALLVLGLLALLTAGTWSFWAGSRNAAVAYVEALPNYLKQQTNFAEAIYQDSSFLDYFLERDELRYLEEMEPVIRQLEELEENRIGLFLLREKQVLLSSGLVDWQPSDTLLPASFIWRTASEVWLAESQEVRSDVKAIRFLALHEAPRADFVRFLPEGSANSKALSLPLSLSLSVAEQESLPTSLVKILLLLFGTLSLWYSAHYYYQRWRREHFRRALILILGAGTVLCWWWKSPAWEGSWLLLSPIFDSPLLPDTLIGLLGQALVALWMFRAFYELFQLEMASVGHQVRSLLSGLLYLASLATLAGIAFWLKTAMTNSRLFFNLDQVLQLNLAGGVLATSLLGLLLGLALLAKRLSTVAHNWLPALNQRLLGMVAAIILSNFIVGPLDLGISVWAWSLLGFIFLMLLDLQLDSGPFSLTWLMVWFILFASFSASLSYKYSLEKEHRVMQEQAASLLSSLTQKMTAEQSLAESPWPDRYAYLIVSEDKQFFGNGYTGQLNWSAITTLTAEEELSQIEQQRIQLQRTEAGRLVILQKELGSYFQPLSLFALYFSLILGLFLLMVVLNYRWPVLPDFLVPVFQTSNSLRNRIQLAVIGIVLLSSLVIGWVTIWYFRDSAAQAQERAVLERIQELEAELAPLSLRELSEWAEPAGEFLLYNPKGALLYQGQERSAPYWMPASVLEILRVALEPYQLRTDLQYQRRIAYAPIQAANGNIKAYLGIPYKKYSENRAREINNFIGSAFSLYVFFMFVAAGIAIWVANSITEPISQIGEGLRNLRLGGNVPLSWKKRDEIGLLVQEYNTALAKLEESTQQLRKAEREGAWRDMAQQVAHEIKNPLTPMKLSVQHLLRAYQADPEAIGPLLQRMSHTLIEQIEGLTKIANEFSNFAKMPEAKIERLEIGQLLRSTVDLFDHQKEAVKLDLELREASLYVEADKDQLLRVFNNLLTNAVQAIPDGRAGQVQISAERQGSEIQIIVADNGKGIPEALQDKVFYPYFTTKSSGTGIGLSMCRNIIEQFGGRIYFSTKLNEGTRFYVVLKAAI